MSRLLVLRHEPGASATVERARRLGVVATVVPLFTIEPVAWDAPEAGGFDGLLLTSANAVRFAGPQLQSLRGLPAYAVGSATEAAARDAGFDIAATGDAGADRLLASVDPELKLLHLCGEDRRVPAGIRQSITPVVAYRARAIDTPKLSQNGGYVALIHSSRAGHRFAELVEERGDIAIAAISAAAAEAAGPGWQAVEVADSANDDALLALAERLCNNLSR
jgi:uroporphyrinogen-III synthase